MNPYSDDTDLLHYDPDAFSSAAWASQTLLSATANLAGSTLTFSSGVLTDRPVTPRCVALLSGSVTGAFVVTAVTSTTLTISPLYNDLFDDDGVAHPAPVGSGSGIGVVVRTFSAQARIVSALLRQAAGVRPDTADEQRMTVTNPSAFRRAAALGTLHLITTVRAAAATEETAAQIQTQADVYERAYRRAMRSIVVELDTNGDGRPDVARPLNMLEFQRV